MRTDVTREEFDALGFGELWHFEGYSSDGTVRIAQLDGGGDRARVSFAIMLAVSELFGTKIVNVESSYTYYSPQTGGDFDCALIVGLPSKGPPQ